MISEKFVLPDNPTMTDLLIWCDWLDEQGKSTEELRRLIGEEHQPGYRKDEWIWFSNEGQELSTLYKETEHNKHGVLPDNIFTKIKQSSISCWGSWWKCFDSPNGAWDALMEACQSP